MSYDFINVNLGFGTRYNATKHISVSLGMDVGIPFSQTFRSKIEQNGLEDSDSIKIEGDNRLKGVFLSPYVAVGYIF